MLPRSADAEIGHLIGMDAKTGGYFGTREAATLRAADEAHVSLCQCGSASTRNQAKRPCSSLVLRRRHPFQVGNVVVRPHPIDVVDGMSGRQRRVQERRGYQPMDVALEVTVVDGEDYERVAGSGQSRLQDAAGVRALTVSNISADASPRGDGVVPVGLFNGTPFFSIVNRHRHGLTLGGGVDGPAAMQLAQAHRIVGGAV